MDGFKQFCLLWTLLSAAAICVLCQQQQILTSTLREGNYTCQGVEVVFTCTVSDSILSVLVIGWRSDEYIGPDALLQFTTNDMQGENRTSMINGNVTAILTRNTDDNGVLMVESTLHIVATVPSEVTCGVTDRQAVISRFSVSVLPGAPQNVRAAEVSERNENMCIILVQWDPPTNSDPSDIARYGVSVTPQGIMNFVLSAISVLQVPNCLDEDTHVQVAAMNRFGCEGMNSSEVQPTLLDIQTVTTPNGSVTTEDGSASTTEAASASSQLGVGGTVGIAILSVALLVFILIGISIIICISLYYHLKPEPSEPSEPTVKGCLLELYAALARKKKHCLSCVNGRPEEISDSFMTSAMGALRAVLKKAEATDVRDAVLNSLVILKKQKPSAMRKALDYLMKIIPDPDMASIDNEFKNSIEELRRSSSEKTLLENALDSITDEVFKARPDEAKKILLRLCDVLFEKLLGLSDKQKEVVEQFEISLESLKKVERLLSAEFTKGLESEEEREDVKVKMFVTHVHEMPKGTEEGEFLVVDLGVNHLRVVHINIVKGRIRRQDPEMFCIDKMTKHSSSYETLFDFIVERIAWFIKNRNIMEPLPIGFTFPFPMKHETLTCGKLIRWTRDFRATGAEGKFVVQLLKEAASEKNKDAASKEEDTATLEIDVVALINDTTGILLSVGNEVPDCHIGLALGDGSNACYMEELSAIPKFSGDRSHSKVIVNTEWGAFGDDGKLDRDLLRIRNKYDHQFDENSSNRGQQLFEKMISDKYQGVIVCLVLKDLICEQELFGGQSSPKFDKLNFEIFNTQRLSTMEGWDMEKCKKLFKNRFDIEASDKDCEVIRRVCVAVSTRAARLAAVGIVALVKKINKMDGCTVAVDGSLYKREPFPERLRDALDELAPTNNIKMKLTEDGPSIGAAFAAAMNSPPSSTPRSISPEAEGSEGPRGQDITGSGTEEPTAAAAVKNLNYVNIEDQGRHPSQAQAQAGDIELPQIVVDNQQ